MSKTLFRNARIIDPATDSDTRGDLFVEDEKITAIGAKAAPAKITPDIEVVECNGLVLSPGLVDMRVVTGEPGAEHKETLGSASRSAAVGGVTSFVVMPDTDPVIDEATLVDFIKRRGRARGDVHIIPAGALTKGLEGKQMSELGLMKDAGAFLFTNGGRPITDARVMRRVMTYARGFDLLVMHRAEDPALGQGVMNESDLSSRLGLAGIPAEAETIMLQRDLALAALTGVRYVMDMASSSRSVDLLRAARKSGQKVGGTVTINHLLLNENDVGDYRTFAKLSPPLRGEDDRQALVRAVAEGVIEYVVSGHVPQPAEDKRLPFSEAAFGSSGLEALLPGLLTLVQTEDLTLMQALRSVTSAPADLLGLWQGRLAIGAPADIILINPDRPFVFDADSMLSRSKNSALDGRRLQGRAELTMVSGKIVHRAAA